MTQALSPTIKTKNRLWTADGAPVGFWSTVSNWSGELFWVLAGKFALMGANAAVMLLLANRLELKTYALLVITISGQLLISRLLMMGVDAGMVRLTAIPELKSRSQEVVTAGLLLIGYASVGLVLIMLVGIPVFSRVGVPTWVVLCVGMGAIGTAFVDYGYSYRLERQEYPLAALAQGGTAVWRFALTALAVVTLPAYGFLVFVAYHGASLVSGLAQALVISKVSHRPERGLIKRLLSYSSWLGQANVVVIFSLYQGTFILTILKQDAETGRFGLALTLSLGFFAIFQAYSEYLSVRVRSVQYVKEIPRFIKRAFAAAFIMALACVPVVFVIATLVPWLLGPEWHAAVPIFLYLSAAMVLLIFQAPLVATCHYLLKPRWITFSWVIQAAIILVVGLLLSPHMGARGAAIAQLSGSVLAFVLLSYQVGVSWRSAAKAEG
jgi:O-antigen/teichoic acid export membrane protein